MNRVWKIGGILLVLFLMVGCLGMKVLSSDTKYDKIVELPGKSKDEIYTKAMQFFAESFGDSKEAIMYQDKEAGKIVGKGNMDVNIGLAPLTLYFDWNVAVKNDKARMMFKNFSVSGRSEVRNQARNIYEKEFDGTKDELESFLKEFEAYMKAEADDNW